MMLSNLEELELSGVYDRGKPNNERIVTRSILPINLASYGVMLGRSTARFAADPNNAIPIPDNLFWFGNIDIAANTYIFLYTCGGNFRVTTTQAGDYPALVYHWGKSLTVLNDPDIVPIIFRMDSVIVGSKQWDITKFPSKQS